MKSSSRKAGKVPAQKASAAEAASREWKVYFFPAFSGEFKGLAEDVQDELLAAAKALKTLGPRTGRPLVDTLKASKHKNMKELRFKAGNGAEIWRAAFAFDPDQQAWILCAGDKQGKSESEFYRKLIKLADARFDEHLATLRDKE